MPLWGSGAVYKAIRAAGLPEVFGNFVVRRAAEATVLRRYKGTAVHK
jgi:hypothetical protein